MEQKNAFTIIGLVMIFLIAVILVNPQGLGEATSSDKKCGCGSCGGRNQAACDKGTICTLLNNQECVSSGGFTSTGKYKCVCTSASEAMVVDIPSAGTNPIGSSTTP